MQNQYVYVATRLPYLTNIFSYTKEPIVYAKWQEIIADLTEAHQQELLEIQKITKWGAGVEKFTMAEYFQHADKLLRHYKKNTCIYNILFSTVNLRIYVAVLRLQQTNNPIAMDFAGTIFETTIDNIIAKQKLPYFGMEYEYPWIKDALPYLRADKSFEFERFLLNHHWQLLAKMSANNWFNFNAIVIFMLKMNLIRRWLKYDAERAKSRLENMINDYVKELQLGDFNAS